MATNNLIKGHARQKRPQIVSGAELRSLRGRAGLSLKRASVALGVGIQTLVDYEADRYAAPKPVVLLLQLLAARREEMINNHRADILRELESHIRVSL